MAGRLQRQPAGHTLQIFALANGAGAVTLNPVDIIVGQRAWM